MDWRETLFVWRGEVSASSTQQTLWKGTWVGTLDPVANFPSSSDFAESPNEFEMYLSSKILPKKMGQSYDSGDKRNFYLLDNGDGLDRYQDLYQQIYVCDYHHYNDFTKIKKCLRVIARGTTEFGAFVSYGKWFGSQLTLARRYVDDKDWRLKVEPLYLLFQDFLGAGAATMAPFAEYAPWTNLPLKCKRPRNSGLNEREVKKQMDRNRNGNGNGNGNGNENENENENENAKAAPTMKLLPISSAATIQKCKAFQSDLPSLYITSYPKSGTTMLQHIVISLYLAQAKAQTSSEAAAALMNKYVHVSKFAPFYEIDATWKTGSDSGQLVDEYSKNHRLLGTHIFNTHLLYDMLPSASASNDRKCIYIIRNAKDAVVSFYHHLSNQQEESGGIAKSDFRSFFKQWIEGDIVYGQWIDHMMHTFSRYSKEKHDLLILCYEDLLSEQGLRDNVHRIVSFLNLQLSNVDIEDVLPSFSFRAMKQNIDRFQPISVKWKEGYSFLRKGVKGDANDTFFNENESEEEKVKEKETEKEKEKENSKKVTTLEHTWKQYKGEKMRQYKEATLKLPERLYAIVQQCLE